MPLPLYGFMEGDTIGLLIVADEQESVRSLAGKLRDAASLRVDGGCCTEVVYRGIVLDPDSTLAQADFKPLQRFDLRRNHGLSESSCSR
jgi:Toluene-4-monooxygenase system protein B (TmoB)